MLKKTLFFLFETYVSNTGVYILYLHELLTLNDMTLNDTKEKFAIPL